MKARVNAQQSVDGEVDATDYGFQVGDTVEIIGFVTQMGVLHAVVVPPMLDQFVAMPAWLFDPLVTVTA